VASKSILLIEDSRFTTALVKEELEDRGFEVETASTGEMGLQLCGQRRPDAVILDLVLPDVSGESVCKDLKRRYESLPVIMLTAKGSDADKVIGKVIGADAYIPKPFAVEDLVREIERLT
jgi:DNA-binding response OmpR family regulator